MSWQRWQCSRLYTTNVRWIGRRYRKRPGYLLSLPLSFHRDESRGIAAPDKKCDVTSFSGLVEQLVELLDGVDILIIDA